MSHQLEAASSCPFIALIGPTAVGKSDLALQLAAQLPLEIINADSRQVYRHMNIGTSKPTAAERALVAHHILDVVDPDEGFSLSDYLPYARRAISNAAARGHIPLVVGGSGQYVWALVEDWQVPQVPPDSDFRQEMEGYAAVHGHEALHERLASIDVDAALRIQSTNVRRVIRALELFRATGVRPSLLLARRREPQSNVVVIGLTLDRPLLFARVDARIDTMVTHGFPEEVTALLAMGYSPSLPSMSSIGYREMADFVTGKTDLATAIALLGRETRRLVRRQHSWFRLSDRRIIWLDAREPVVAVRQAAELIQGTAT